MDSLASREDRNGHFPQIIKTSTQGTLTSRVIAGASVINSNPNANYGSSPVLYAQATMTSHPKSEGNVMLENAQMYTSLPCKDIKSTSEQLRANGVDFEHYDNIPGVTRDGDIHFSEDKSQYCWFKD